MIERGNKKKKEYPKFQINYQSYVFKCILGRENGSCSLIYEGYLKGAYSTSNLVEILDCFAKTVRELPITVSLGLENKITESDEYHSLLSFAMESISHQREHLLSTINPAVKKILDKTFSVNNTEYNHN